MANEIVRVYGNSQASPIALANWEDGTFTLTFSGDTTSSLAYNASAATIQTALEGLASIGSGNVVVTATADGFTAEFQGSLANTDVGALTCTPSLKQKADTISVTNTQNGTADAGVTPSNSTTTSAVAAVDEVQLVNLGSASTGTFDLNGNSTSATVNSLDTSGVQTACDAIWGTGNTSVSGSGPFTVGFQGSFAGQPIAEMTVSNNSTDGSPYVSTNTDGVTGVHQQDTCTFSGTATGGAMTFDGQSLAYNADGSSLFLSGATASGTPASGTITTTWSDYSSHTAFSVGADTLVAAGQPQVVRVQCTDSPTEGQVYASFNSNTASWNFDNSLPGPPSGFTLTSGATNDWTFTASSNASNVSCSADDSGTPLRKDLPIEIVTVQEGSSGGGGSTGAANLLTLGVG